MRDRVILMCAALFCLAAILGYAVYAGDAQAHRVALHRPTPATTAPRAVSATATGPPSIPSRTSTPHPSATPPTTPLATSTPVVPFTLSAAAYSLFTINPVFTRETITFTLSRAARVAIRIAPIGLAGHVRTILLRRPAGLVTTAWDGRDNAHRLVPEGQYTDTITAVDETGERQTETDSVLNITFKRIVISLGKQALWAYDGTKPFLSHVLVTTGNPALPTPLGHFPILARYSPFTFVSPWPPGSTYYYAPSPTTYALLFDNRGYYIHDAPWRTRFGPGSNVSTGTPGQDYTGSHGCVNVPLAAEAQLFAWATIGTIVEVIP